MIEVRRVAGLGGQDHGWLDAKHHFSFGQYRDEGRRGWGSLLVWNDDAIAPGHGFPPHPHRDMEIITYVREGAITHEDSLGNHGRTEAGDVQVISAGSGIVHSEANREPIATRLFQIWIRPTSFGGAPSWGAKPFSRGARAGRWVTLASGLPGDDDALPLRTDARVAGATLPVGGTLTYALAPSRHAYLVPALGRIALNGHTLEPRDGAAILGETELRISALDAAELILVDAA